MDVVSSSGCKWLLYGLHPKQEISYENEQAVGQAEEQGKLPCTTGTSANGASQPGKASPLFTCPARPAGVCVAGTDGGWWGHTGSGHSLHS